MTSKRKDRRPDLPQVVVGLAVTREGIPVRARHKDVPHWLRSAGELHHDGPVHAVPPHAARDDGGFRTTTSVRKDDRNERAGNDTASVPTLSLARLRESVRDRYTSALRPRGVQRHLSQLGLGTARHLRDNEASRGISHDVARALTFLAAVRMDDSACANGDWKPVLSVLGASREVRRRNGITLGSASPASLCVCVLAAPHP